jgi:formamidopyrimidine-DNA glycosylase
MTQTDNGTTLNMNTRKKRYCNKCDGLVHEELEKVLREEYPFYCPNCEENMYRFETHTKA